MSKNVLSADNQQGRLKSFLDPWYIVGFVEGEGTFHIAFYKDPRMKQNIKVIPEFHINQSYLRINTLNKIKEYFNCGYIKANHAKNNKDTTYVYVVRDRDDLINIIIPFFQKYCLYSIKQESFNIFAKIVHLIKDGKHRTKQGLKQIIKLAYQMNIKGKYRLRKKEELIKILKPSETIR